MGNNIEPTPNGENEKTPYKSPGLAFMLSFLITGTGQIYNGDVEKGITQFVMVGSGVALVIYYLNRRDRFYGKVGLNFARLTGFALAAGGSVWSIIDAPISANKKNKKFMRKSVYGHFLEINSGKQIVGFDLGCRDKILGGQVTLHF